MNYKTTWAHQPGYTEIVRPGDAGLTRIGFGLLSLRSGKRFTIPAAAKETAVVLLHGAATVEGPGLAGQKIGPRGDVFHERPWTVMLSPNKAYEIAALDDLELAVCQAPSSRQGVPQVIPPDGVKEVVIGRDNWRRRALIMVDENVPADYLFIGEAIVDSGNWASFPPHRHEQDDLPDEVEMEEVYYFRFDRPQGFGIQKVYTDDRSIDETLTVTEHDTIPIPRGYHPVVAAPGSTMYYLWIMAGKNRRFLSRIDPDHRAILQS